ncbi:MAG: PilZ domain-containing protein [Candidatus Omnitrophica bacterium]|nr:PilZ domain-containing protein [Candidatus Omnitrophota bacterium]
METKEKGNTAERRRAKRIYASFVEYCRVDDASSKKFQAFTENISTTGICIFINEDIKTDSFLFITIYLLDGSTPIETKGKVAWIRPSTFLNIVGKQHFDVGIEFVEITKEDRDRLIYYTNRYGGEIPPSKK